MVRTIFGIIHPQDLWKIWNCLRFTRAVPKFSKMHSGNLSQAAFPNMWLLVLIYNVKQNIWYFLSLYRTSYWRCSVKKGDLKYFANFTGKHLCLSLFSIMLIKKRLQRGCFPVKFVNFLRAPVLKNICKRLLLPLLF